MTGMDQQVSPAPNLAAPVEAPIARLLAVARPGRRATERRRQIFLPPFFSLNHPAPSRPIFYFPSAIFHPPLTRRKWYPHPELNRDQRFRKPPLYPFELWGQQANP